MFQVSSSDGRKRDKAKDGFMKFLIFLGLIVTPIFFYGEVRADDMSVINVRRNIQLSENDPVYRDFYIDGGEDNGLKKNMVVQAIRKMSIRDASGAHAFGEIKIPVGQLKIIAVYPKVAVAREFKLLSRDDLPMLEQIGIMTGDLVETKGSFIDRRPNAVPLSGGAPAALAPQNSQQPQAPTTPQVTVTTPLATAELAQEELTKASLPATSPGPTTTQSSVTQPMTTQPLGTQPLVTQPIVTQPNTLPAPSATEMSKGESSGKLN